MKEWGKLISMCDQKYHSFILAKDEIKIGRGEQNDLVILDNR